MKSEFVNYNGYVLTHVIKSQYFIRKNNETKSDLATECGKLIIKKKKCTQKQLHV